MLQPVCMLLQQGLLRARSCTVQFPSCSKKRALLYRSDNAADTQARVGFDPCVACFYLLGSPMPASRRCFTAYAASKHALLHSSPHPPRTTDAQSPGVPKRPRKVRSTAKEAAGMLGGMADDVMNLMLKDEI